MQGANSHGQIGLADLIDRHSPIAIPEDIMPHLSISPMNTSTEQRVYGGGRHSIMISSFFYLLFRNILLKLAIINIILLLYIDNVDLIACGKFREGAF